MAVESFYEAAESAGGGEEGGSGDGGDPNKRVRGSLTLRAQLLTSRAAAAKPANAALDLSSKTNRELVELLRHRDEGMKLAAASVLEKKVCGVLATDVARVSAVEELTKNGLRPLVEILTATASSTQLLYKTVVILIAIFNGTDRLRQVGGLGPLLSHVSSEDSALVKQLLVLITDLALNEQNQDGFRRTGLLDKVVPTLAHPDPEVRLSAAEALVNLSVSVKNQETIAKANALPLVIQALRSDDDHFQLQSLLLLHNLSQCAMAKANFTSEDLALLLTFADAQKLGQEPKERNLIVQRYTLATLAGLASFEKHQHKIGELGAVKMLLPFLELVEGPVPVDGDVLSSVLETFDHLLNLKDNQYMFFQANGHERVLAILRKPQAFSESVVIEAASIVAHLSSSSNSHVFGSIGVRQLNNLLDMYPQNTTMHLLVAKTYASLSQDGHSARLLVANQAELVLAKFILESRTKQVLEHACLALSKLAGFDSVRAYIIQSELVRKLISLLGYSDQSLVAPVTTTLGLVAVKEEGMAAIMDYGGLLPLITLLQSQDTRIQEMALTAIGRVVLADQSSTNRQDLVYRGGLKEMIGLMTSSSPAVQLLVLGILKALAKYEDMREPFQQGGLMEKIRLLADHPNVQKENSNVRQTLRMLLLAVKTLLDAPPTPVSVPSSPMLSALNYTPEEMQKLDTVSFTSTSQLVRLSAS
ncbi:Armadillo/betacatenin-like repeat domain containing protein [Acanthamoeba castellanii str. Neff]|uniref:Armadillo/betacatenin-like repeat domain containing protein n=1 Tax=Acanthamoeba castellanii (strain ATCC 30010 / Neff) TaxID=1257118 RepID=L8GTW4_ACACF|nr:Armadillo/betacatenin-like repeat domain containing protein [Acanthamoeba castellanii str. Neff]ELR16589.1 Armadillo/betacatenin-like repeat domain containing protein [Acanthamoeba castellanii str. Neff]